ncbi:PopZ family protein [Rhizobium sp. SG2393]|uniref:PopZ family protein n=1 Tax=Rhizobium sp. SG2393 TaxID=3276279 RepID=UPI00366B61C1
MAQPNVAREPSMDEILASIRKIIESNEPAQAAIEISARNTTQGSSTSRPQPQIEIEDRRRDEEIGLTIDDALLAHDFSGQAPQMDKPAVTPAARAQSAEPARTPGTSQQSPLSLADIAARVRAASERNASALREAAPSAGTVPVAAAPEQGRATVVSGEPAPGVAPVAAAPQPVSREQTPTPRNAFDALESVADFDDEPNSTGEEMEDQLAAVLASFAEAAEEAVAGALDDAEATRQEAESAAVAEASVAAQTRRDEQPAVQIAPVVEEAPVPAAVAIATTVVEAEERSVERQAVVAEKPQAVAPVAEPVVRDAAAPAPAPAATGAGVAALTASVGALVSPSVGSQVAQSFGALAEAVEYKNRTSFDEMAREMLRPMLQEWLDDNLPTLVERLVREEIERVARGGSR